MYTPLKGSCTDTPKNIRTILRAETAAFENNGYPAIHVLNERGVCIAYQCIVV